MANLESEVKEKKSTIAARSSSISKNKKKDKLPWWVEVLFVQLRLPESLLIKLLDTKKDSVNLISKYNREIKIVSLLSLLVIYLNPIVLLAKRQNLCISMTLGELSNFDNKYRRTYLSKAINYCNGGSDN